MTDKENNTKESKPRDLGSLVIISTIVGVTAYWFGMFEWMKYHPSHKTSLIVAFVASIAASILMFFGFWTRPKGGWHPKSVWGPLMVVVAFALTFFFLLTLIKLL